MIVVKPHSSIDRWLRRWRRTRVGRFLRAYQLPIMMFGLLAAGLAAALL